MWNHIIRSLRCQDTDSDTTQTGTLPRQVRERKYLHQTGEVKYFAYWERLATSADSDASRLEESRLWTPYAQTAEALRTESPQPSIPARVQHCHEVDSRIAIDRSVGVR